MISIKKNWRHILAAAFVVALVLTSAYIAIDTIATVFGECRAAILDSVQSPNGKKSVVIYRAECGATVGYSIQASIAPTGAKFSFGRYPAFFIVNHTPVVIARWLGDSEVEISVVPGGEQIFKNEDSVEGIRIKYLSLAKD